MRIALLQIIVALLLVVAAALWWRFADYERAQASVTGASDVASNETLAEAGLVRSTLPDVIYVDPATFLPAALCVIVDEPREDVTLREAAEAVADVSGLPCRIREQDLIEEGMSAEEVVSLPAGVPLYMALDRMVSDDTDRRGHDLLAWSLEDGIIVITTQLAALDDLQMHAFEADEAAQLFNGEWQDLIDVLLAHGNGEWVDIDGVGGEIDVAGNALAVRQTFAAMRQVAALLDGMQRQGQRVLVSHPPADALAVTALETPVNGWFRGVPLDTAAASLAEQTGITITLAFGELAGVGVAPDDPVNCQLRDQPLRIVLDAMLEDVVGEELGYEIADGRLNITTSDVLARRNQTVIYNVEDLLTVMQGEELVDMVQNQVSGEWVDIDGVGGEIDVLPHLSLVVTNTQRTHEEIEQLLESLRQSVYVPNASDPNALVSRTYRLSSTLAEDLEPVMRQLVAPESWQDPFRLGQSGAAQVYTLRLDPAHTTLVIHQTVDNHRHIERLLDRIDPHGYGHPVH